MNLPFNTDAIPEELKHSRNWVLWKREPRLGKEGKPTKNPDGSPAYTKIPYTIDGKKAAVNNPKNREYFQNVVNTFQKRPDEYTGIGFVLSKETGLIGIDFDHVRNPNTGEWNQAAWEEIKELNSYTELSPSGSGCHVFVKGKLPPDSNRPGEGRRKEQPDGTEREMYQDLHFLTFTGNKVDGLPDTINRPHGSINKCYEKWFSQEKQEAHRRGGRRNQEKREVLRDTGEQERGNRKLSDPEIIEKISAATNSDKFNKLYNGDFEGYTSQSEADLAFASMLAFYTQDREQIDRIFRKSGLHRKEKGTDYRKRTIETAIKGQKETYNPDKKLGRKAAATSKHRREGEGKSEEEKEDSEPIDYVSQYPEDIQEFAYRLLKEGDPFSFMLDTWSIRHVGDRNIGENCLCAAATVNIINSNGLHTKPSGESGKGKSDGMDTGLLLLPPRMYIKGSLSAKNLFYDDSLPDGLIVYCDDVGLNQDMISTVKQSTSSFQERKLHRTLINQKATSLYLPARLSWWFSSVDGHEDPQLANRFLNCDVDGSREQDIRVLNHIKNIEETDLMSDDTDLLICRCMFDILAREKYVIKIPFIKAIDWRNPENRRNFKKFLDIIRAVTFFKVFQRDTIKGYYLAEYEDYERARDIYKGTAKHNATNLTDKELQVLQFIAGKNKYDCNGELIIEAEVETQQIMKKFDLSQGRVHQIIHGKEGNGGMLAKIPNLSVIEKSVSSGDGGTTTTKRKNGYVYRGKPLGLEIFDSVAILDKEKAKQATEAFKKSLTEDTITSITPLLPHYYPYEVIAKSSITDRINNNIILNSKRERERENYGSSLSSFPSPSPVYNSQTDGKLSKEIKSKNEQSKKQSNNNNSFSQVYGNRVIENNSEPPDNDSSITQGGNSRVIEGNRGNSKENSNSGTITHNSQDEVIEGFSKFTIENIKAIDDPKNAEHIKFLRKEIETYHRTYIRKHGGVENTGELVKAFLKEYPGFTNSWSFGTVLSEAEKICKKIPVSMGKTPILNRDTEAPEG